MPQTPQRESEVLRSMDPGDPPADDPRVERNIDQAENKLQQALEAAGWDVDFVDCEYELDGEHIRARVSARKRFPIGGRKNG